MSISKIQHTFKKNWALISIVVAGLALRLYHLSAISLWHDEAFSALLIKYSWGEMFYRIGLDVHPPMYYIFLRIWHYILGNSLWSLRGLSVAFGIATIIAAYFLVKEIFKNEKTALIAALLIAVSPFQVQYVLEARMYTMGAFFALLAAWALIKALRAQKQYYDEKKLNQPNLPQDRKLKKRFLLYYLIFAVSTAIIMLTHYYLMFTAAALGLYALLFHLRHYKDQVRRYSWLILSYILIGLFFLPWLKIFLFQFRQVGAGYWIPPMDRWSVPDTLWRMVVGLYTGSTPTHWMLVIITLLSLFILYKVIRHNEHYEKWLIVLNVIAPFAGAVLFYLLAQLRGQDSSVYLVRYFLFCSAFYLILFSLWWERLKPRKLANVILVVLVGVNLFAVIHYWVDLDVKTKPGMAAAARLLNASVASGDKLYVGSSFEFFNFKYYNRTPIKALLYSGGITSVKQLPHYAGTAILTDEDLLPDFKTATKNGDTVWLIWTNGFGGSRPEVPKNWTQIDEHGFAEVRPYVGTWVIVTEYKVN
jgi:mannosyltransferase